MVARIHLVAGDSHPVVYAQLRDPDAPVDISLAAVTMAFRPDDDLTVLFTLNGELLPGTLEPDLLKPDLSQYPTPGSGGRVRFAFMVGMLSNVAPGFYVGEIAADFGAGNSLHPFKPLQFVVREPG